MQLLSQAMAEADSKTCDVSPTFYAVLDGLESLRIARDEQRRIYVSSLIEGQGVLDLGNSQSEGGSEAVGN